MNIGGLAEPEAEAGWGLNIGGGLLSALATVGEEKDEGTGWGTEGSGGNGMLKIDPILGGTVDTLGVALDVCPNKLLNPPAVLD